MQTRVVGSFAAAAILVVLAVAPSQAQRGAAPGGSKPVPRAVVKNKAPADTKVRVEIED